MHSERPREESDMREDTLMNAFRLDIQKLIDREKNKKQAWEETQQDAAERGERYEGESYSADAVDISVDDLTETDRAIWEKIRAGTITPDEWRLHDANFKEEMLALEKEKRDEAAETRIKKSRWAFHSVAADEAMKASKSPW